METGIRVDKNTPVPEKPSSGYFVLPRINVLIKLNRQFSSRIGGGLGYKMPSLFNDLSEQEGYQNLKPLTTGNTQAEQSYGLNADLNYRAVFGDNYLISINQLFFYTYVDRPLILQQHAFVNAHGHLDTKGTETNIKLTFDELIFYLGYTITNTRQIFNRIVSEQPLTPRNQLNFDCSYEAEGNFRIGAECFYTGPQILSDGTTGRGYVTMGLLVQKSWKHLDLFINGEDLTDVRQTRWGSIYTGSMSQPVFKDIFAPLDGRVINLGIRIKVLN
jgi:iron complex outermembrane receptor protein